MAYNGLEIYPLYVWDIINHQSSTNLILLSLILRTPPCCLKPITAELLMIILTSDYQK